jgi:anti-sigma B factor antagonist
MDPAGLRVYLRTFHGGVVLSLHGELDVATVRELARKVDVVVAAAPAVCIVDLAELRFVDSKGLHAILEANRRLRGWCEGVVFQGLRPNVRKVMDLVGITPLLDVADP